MAYADHLLRIGQLAIDAEVANQATRSAKAAYWGKIREYEEEVRTLDGPMNCSHEDAHLYTRIEYTHYKDCKRNLQKMKRRLQVACARALK